MKNMPAKSQEQYWSTDGGEIWLKNLKHFESMIEPIGQVLIQIAMSQAGSNVIDIGCGGGATTLKLAELIGDTGSVIGLDISKSLIAECRQRAEQLRLLNVEFICGDAATVVFPDQWADLALSRFGVMFFEEPIMAFMNIGNSLKKNGSIIFSCWGPIDENPWMNELLKILSDYTDLPKPEPGTPGPFAFAQPDYITTVIGSAGYSNIEIIPWSGNLLIGSPGMDTVETVKFLLRSSALVQNLKEALVDVQQDIFDRLVKKLDTYYKINGVYMPAKAWIVSARR